MVIPNEKKFPLSHEDVMRLYEEFIYEGETDEDVFTWSETKTGLSYSFYGTKVMSLKPGTEITARLSVVQPGEAKDKVLRADSFTQDELAQILEELKERKHKIFRNVITEKFACCNDFLKCSDAKACIHPEDRFYNGCTYRQNLENGRIFYGKNRNID